MTVFGISCSECGSLDTDAVLGVADSDGDAEAALQTWASSEGRNWQCPSCGADATHYEVVEL
jgi:rubrerythrin